MWMKSLIIRQYQYWRRFRCFSHQLRYTKFFLCIMIIYFLNVVTDFQYYIWSGLGKLFQDKYYLPITHIDIRKLEENEEYRGPPNNTLPNSYVISNKYLCRKDDLRTMKPPHLLILVKSAIENKQARQAIRMTWGGKPRLDQYHIKLAFVLGNTHLIRIFSMKIMFSRSKKTQYQR